MSPGYRLTSFALEDLDEIWMYIARDSMSAAERVEAAIYDACRKLSRNPFLGRKSRRKSIGTLRFWNVPRFPNYMIVYEPETKPLQVVAVLQASREITRILRTRRNR